MNFNYTIQRLIKKADQEQAQRLIELSEVEKPNSIQIATLNEIKLAIAQSHQKLQLVNELKNKITNRGLTLIKKVRSYPSDHIIRFKEILENQTFLENKLEFLYLLEFLVPQETSIKTYIQTLAQKENLNPSNIEIKDFSTFTLEDFQEKQIQEPKMIVPKRQITTRKPKTQVTEIKNSIENPKQFNKLVYLLTNFKRSICITLCLAIYHTTIRKTPSSQTQISAVGIINKAMREGTCSTPSTLDNLTQVKIDHLYNFYKVDFKEYIAGFEDTNNSHFRQHMQFSFIIKQMNNELNQINSVSPYPVMLKMNFIDSTTKEHIFSNTSITKRPTVEHQRNPQSANFRYLVNMDIEGFVYSRNSQSSFIPTNINILNPVYSESDIEEKYIRRVRQK